MTPSIPEALDDRSLQELLHRATEPVVVESYHGGWDRPWRVFDGAAWETLQLDLGERVRCATVETSANREIAHRYGVEIVPELLVFLEGEVVARFRHRARAMEVVDAVRGALHERRVRAEALGELEGVTTAREVLSSVRSVLRRRTAVPEASLSRAG